MDALIDGLSNFFIQHPFAQASAGYLGKALGGLFVLLLCAGCWFLAFGRQRSFYYRIGSLVEKCWKAGWLLQMAVIANLSYRELTGSKNISVTELICDALPTALLLFAQLYGSKYHKTIRAERRKAKREQA